MILIQHTICYMLNSITGLYEGAGILQGKQLREGFTKKELQLFNHIGCVRCF